MPFFDKILRLFRAHREVVSDRLAPGPGRAAIIAFACGDHSARESALEAYLAARKQGVGTGKDPAMRFMAEIDNAVTDLGRRADARQDLRLEAALAAASGCDDNFRPKRVG